LLAFWVPFFVSSIERALSDKMVVFMEFPASEGNVFIVDGLGPVLVMIFQYYGSWECLGYVQVHTDSRIRGKVPLLGGFRRLNIYAYGITYAGQDLLHPELLGERVYSYPYRCVGKVLLFRDELPGPEP
jgi:hypothetical protein